MKLLSALALAGGFALLAWLLAALDLAAAAQIVTAMGWLGAGLALLPFAAGFAVEIAAWGLLFPKPLLTPRWLGRLWLVNMVGEAFNILMPFGTLGGEPFKALLLKRHYRMPYGDSGPPLVMMQAMLAMAQAPFALIGAGLALDLHKLPPYMEAVLLATALGFAAVMLLALAAWQGRWLERVPRWLERQRFGARLARLTSALDAVEQQMFRYIRQHKARFAAALGLFFANWVAGAVEIWVILHLIGAPLSLAECWAIEAAVVLVRTATFFVPANLGTFEAVTVFVTAAFTGSLDTGLALALIRRARELFWSALGLGVGGWYHWRRAL